MTETATTANLPNQTRHLGPESAKIKQSLALRSAEFRKGREKSWRDMENMISRIEKSGIASLSAEEVQQLPLLYRTVVSSLSVARNIVLDRNLLLYLENLSLRSYLVVYGPRTGMLQSLYKFFRFNFPQYVRDIRWHLLLIFIVLAAAAIAGYLLVRSDLSYYTMLMPESMVQSRTVNSSPEELMEVMFDSWPGLNETLVFFATYLFQHNTMVGIFSFALGFALGVPTIILIGYNGLVVGAFVGLHFEKGIGIHCLGWLSIHGITEFLAILLCAAAGLLVAQKIIFPGALTRVESLAIYGRKAASIMAGSVAIFFCAAILEGFFRQGVNSTPGRFVVAAITAVFWLFYFTQVGRVKKDGSAK